MNLDEIRKYLDEKGPKKVVNPNFHIVFWLHRKLSGKEDSEYDQKYIHKKNERIKEIIPDEGQIILSGSDTTVIMYNEERGRLERANFDIKTGQPVHDSEYTIDSKEIVPASLMEVVCFSGHAPLSEFRNPRSAIISDLARWNLRERKDQAAGFLEKLIEFSGGVPIIEIGQNIGDTYNRFFPARKYGHR